MRRNPFPVRPGRDRGFALVVSLMLMVLLALLAVGLLGISSIELRRSSAADSNTIAKSNARMALMLALGQLQRTLGPDQRVSATAEILPGNPKQSRWTGAWKSTRDDGTPWLRRDDLAGGLRDGRADSKAPPGSRVIEWLVSGAGTPESGPTGSPLTVGRDESGLPIEVSLLPVRRRDGALGGHHAWWTGDLGTRANLATADAWATAAADDQRAPWFRVMASQAVDSTLVGEGRKLAGGEAAKLASAGTAGLTSLGAPWSGKHVFDLTYDSQAVLADVANGGLKRDLTAFLQSDGAIPAKNDLPGLSDEDPVIGHLEAPPERGGMRAAHASPTFGILRDWANLRARFDGRDVSSRMPETHAASTAASASMALANDTPVKLAGNTRSGLKPVLVEATQFVHLSTFSTGTPKAPQFRLRNMLYPRVVLWNPYNVELEFDRSMIMIQGNGRQEMWTENIYFDRRGNPLPFTFTAQWLSFEGGRSTSFNSSGKGIMNTEGYNDPYIGSYYYAIPKTRFAPGECLVFSPARAAEYDCLTPYRTGSYNLNANELSCEVSPDPSRVFYISGSDLGGGIPFKPILYWYAPTPYWSQNGRNGVENQADDTRAVLKQIRDPGPVTFEGFDRAPQISVLSSSLQYGAGREPRIAWGKQVRMPIEMLPQNNPRATFIPDVRTREGVRLRWFMEHPSNLLNSGALSGTPYLQEAVLANWNPRASYIVRSPWENIGGSLPKSGTAGGPWFFGVFNRDLFDQAVSWEDQVPVFSNGRFRGNPFGPPQEGADRIVLFDVPRDLTGVVSLAQFQHAPVSELVWHPSYAIGNSLADPRLGLGGNKGLERSAAVPGDASAASSGGFHPSEIGWSADSQRSSDRGAWAAHAQAILDYTPASANLVQDLSFELNQALWDRFFLSTGTPGEKIAFARDPFRKPLPNGRMKLVPGPSAEQALTDFHQAASRLMLDGAFNVNSTRVEAWKALLGSTRPSGFGAGDRIAFPRVLDPPAGPWATGDPSDGDAFWAGHRELTPAEIDSLARALVAEVKSRGPFLSLADFVNRRLAADETGRMGALEAAILKSGINSTIAADHPLDNSAPLPDYKHPDQIADSTRMEQTLKPDCMAWGAPAHLTQADVLQVIGPALSARSDTFVIRAYGDAVDAKGKTTATAWCEALVQRIPEPLDPDALGLNPRLQGRPGDFGRRFLIRSFRWLSPAEIQSS